MICRADGTIVKDPFSPPQFSYAYLKHFTTKSTEEYIIKLFKGNVSYNDTLNLNSLLFWINIENIKSVINCIFTINIA